jgi:hypothetical protein
MVRAATEAGVRSISGVSVEPGHAAERIGARSENDRKRRVVPAHDRFLASDTVRADLRRRLVIVIFMSATGGPTRRYTP